MSAFHRWVAAQDSISDWDNMTPTEQMRLAWTEAIKAAAKECKDYANSNSNVYRRNVANACRRRVEALNE